MFSVVNAFHAEPSAIQAFIIIIIIIIIIITTWDSDSYHAAKVGPVVNPLRSLRAASAEQPKSIVVVHQLSYWAQLHWPPQCVFHHVKYTGDNQTRTVRCPLRRRTASRQWVFPRY